ncbi:MAG: 30S ribosomal protein S17 [Chloroflexota bacterium]|nr:30S ribosomal protein S17 [Chloroflexota bacterium]
MSKEMRKVRTGQVVRTSMDRTAVVETVWKQRHRVYRKQMRRVTRFYVHDPLNQCTVGDTVRIQETRPISKMKHWRLLEILQRRQVADVQPIELETDLDAEIAGEAEDESPVAIADAEAEEEEDSEE